MKNRLAHQSFIALAFVALPLLNGCTQQSASNTPAYITTSTTPPPPVVTQVVPPAAAPVAQPATPLEATPATATVPSLIISNAPPVVVAEPVLPANLRISKPLNEIIQLVQSGVEETVILTYITNSPAIFTLGAEEIVYLNDLGVTGPVITAMMQRDQALKYAWATAGKPAPAVVPITNQETVAAAPTYVNPPQTTTVVEAQPGYISNSYFYDTLSPYGTWVEVDGYGRCWRPTVAITSSDWQPYRDRGRWIHTDAGWYWMSDYSWGSVAFHYGRWFSHPRLGWCWWPDTVWAPSWVTWRYDNDNCGWAPLPPRSYYRAGSGFYYHDSAVSVSFDFGLHVSAFTFVPWNRFCDPYPYRHSLPRHRSVAIYNQTTVINNVVIGNNNTVINRGIPTDRVRERTRTDVRTVKIREENGQGQAPRQERFERDGRTLVVRRPQLPPTASVAPAILPGERTTRIAPARGSESTVVNPTPVSGGRPELGNRPERRELRGGVREDENEIRRVIAPKPPTSVAAPAVTVPLTPPGPAAIPERRTRNEESLATRDRENRATVVRLPENTTAPIATPRSTPTPVRTPTPIFSKPVVVQTTPQIPAQPLPAAPDQTAAINGRVNPGRSSGRDSSVWNTPAQPSINTPSAPSYNSPSRSRATYEQPAPVQITQPAPAAPVYNRPNVEVRREEPRPRSDFGSSSRSRSEERSAAPSYTPPAPRATAPVMAPQVAPARPSYTPAPAPAPVAPRVESPSPRSEPRAEPRSESRSEPRSDSGRSPRSR